MKIIIYSSILVISFVLFYFFYAGEKIEHILKIREERKKIELINNLKEIEVEKKQYEFDNFKKQEEQKISKKINE